MLQLLQPSRHYRGRANLTIQPGQKKGKWEEEGELENHPTFWPEARAIAGFLLFVCFLFLLPESINSIFAYASLSWVFSYMWSGGILIKAVS